MEKNDYWAEKILLGIHFSHHQFHWIYSFSILTEILNYKPLYITLGILTMLSSYFLYVTLNHTSDISNFIAVGFVGFVLMVLGIVLTQEKLQKLSAKIFTIHVFAALVTIVIANAMGWVDTDEIIEKIGRFWV